MSTARLVFVLMLAATIALPAVADEILDQINNGIQLYKSGDFAGAASELEFAAAQIRQLRAGEVSGALPKPLAGWTAPDAETSAMGTAFFGGGTSASRKYTKGDASVEVQIVTDSPMLQGVTMLLNNPTLLGASGQKLIRVKGNKAALEWENDHGTIQVVVAGSVLVSVTGYECKQDDLTAYAEAVDYELLKQIMSR
ncbi:MAG: hypothetical protein PHQ53_12570 [Candidatus Krumholzibacteria bacterium]|nr:hypothetical protein [Candidatus Krumholzibacteria bacterium]